jgi:hypothetical protein
MDRQYAAWAAENPTSVPPEVEAELGPSFNRILSTLQFASLLSSPTSESFEAAATRHGLPVLQDRPEFQFSSPGQPGPPMMPASDAPSALSANGMSNIARRTTARRTYASTPAEPGRTTPGRTFSVDLDLGRLVPPAGFTASDNQMEFHHLPFGDPIPPSTARGDNSLPQDSEPRGGLHMENPPFIFDNPFLLLDRQWRVARQASRAAAQAGRTRARTVWAENERQHRRILAARQVSLGVDRALRRTQQRAAVDAQWDDVHIPSQGIFIPGPGSGRP